jgi:hypothetical protein
MTSWRSKHVSNTFAQWTNVDTLVSIVCVCVDIIVL